MSIIERLIFLLAHRTHMLQIKEGIILSKPFQRIIYLSEQVYLAKFSEQSSNISDFKKSNE